MTDRNKSGRPLYRPKAGFGIKHSEREVDPDDRRTRWQFGQNFLVDEGVVRAIAEDAGATPEDWIIEIGPGAGAITKRLSKSAKRITAIEIDPKWVENLRQKASTGALGDLEVIEDDASRIDVERLLNEHAPWGEGEKRGRTLLIGNLPYNKAAPILFHFLPHIRRFDAWQVMVQYEVAKRICAAPGKRDFAFLSVAVQNHAEATLLRKIEPEAFRPRPKVWSATLKLTPRPAPLCGDAAFTRFVELAFSQKRKKLTNVLDPFYGQAAVREAIAAAQAREDARAEMIGVEGFAILFARLGPPSIR